MPTISWKDVAFTEKPGQFCLRERTVLIEPEHVARWKGDPDGRFSFSAPAHGDMPAQLVRFYPSL